MFFMKWGHLGSEGLGNLPITTQPAGAGAGLHSVCLPQSPCSISSIHLTFHIEAKALEKISPCPCGG